MNLILTDWKYHSDTALLKDMVSNFPGKYKRTKNDNLINFDFRAIVPRNVQKRPETLYQTPVWSGNFSEIQLSKTGVLEREGFLDSPIKILLIKLF
jgi:hypothetical protein